MPPPAQENSQSHFPWRSRFRDLDPEVVAVRERMRELARQDVAKSRDAVRQTLRELLGTEDSAGTAPTDPPA